MASVYNFLWVYAREMKMDVPVAPQLPNRVRVPKPFHAVILYPSLFSPAIHQQSDDDPWIELLIASKRNLTPQHVNSQLKVYEGLQATKVFHEETLFPSAYERIEVEPTTPNDDVVATHGKFRGVLHRAAKGLLEGAGFTQLCRVRVHVDCLARAKRARTQIPRAPSVESDGKTWCAETQDELIVDVLRRRHNYGAHRVLPDEGLFEFAVNDRGAQLWNDASGPAVRRDKPIQAYHPLYFYAADEIGHFNFGHLTDIHVNSRHDLLAKSDARVIEAKGAASPTVGSMVGCCNQSVQRMLSEMQSRSDMHALLIGGDLIDHQLNAYTAEAPKNVLEVWDAVDLRENGRATYAPGTDMVAFYSMLMNFCRNSQRPVFGVSGNHDCYQDPFGISPRILHVRANEGIPADLNLTFYEAALAFGPTWTEVQMKSNFEPDWFEWFYGVFTPFSDFSVQLPKQQLVCLGWGNAEQMISMPFSGHGFGHLPRANETFNAAQLSLVKSATQTHAERRVIVLSHFTVASFDGDHPLLDEKGVAVSGHLEAGFNDFNMGTFGKQREDFLRILCERTITCVLTGHSHRRGLYFTKDPILRFNAKTDTSSVTVPATLYDPLDFSPSSQPEAERMPAIVVSDSGGPYPRYNRRGEFGGWGSDVPGGSLVLFDANGGLAKVEVVRAPSTVKPRMAVAADYTDIMLGSAWHQRLATAPFDLQAEKRGEWREGFYNIVARLHPDLQRFGISIASLQLFGHDENVPDKWRVVSTKKLAEDVFSPLDLPAFRALAERAIRGSCFLSIAFACSDDEIRDRYDFSHHWNFEVVMKAKIHELRDPETHRPVQAYKHYEMRRPLRRVGKWWFSDVPNFPWRRGLFEASSAV